MSLSLKRPFIGFLIRWILFRSHLFILDSTIRTHFFLLSAMCGSGDESKFIDRCSMTDIHLSCSCAYVMGGETSTNKNRKCLLTTSQKHTLTYTTISDVRVGLRVISNDSSEPFVNFKWNSR